MAEGFVVAHGCAATKPFFYFEIEESFMTTIVPTQDNTAQQPAAAPAAPAQQPAIIASRQSCDADGVGLSHYILMDRKPSA